MFYCDDCRKEKGWPVSFMRSFGACEMCSHQAVCFDVPSGALPMPPVQSSMRGEVAHMLSDASQASQPAAVLQKEVFTEMALPLESGLAAACRYCAGPIASEYGLCLNCYEVITRLPKFLTWEKGRTLVRSLLRNIEAEDNAAGRDT